MTITWNITDDKGEIAKIDIASIRAFRKCPQSRRFMVIATTNKNVRVKSSWWQPLLEAYRIDMKELEGKS